MNSNLFLSLPNTDDLLTILYSPSAFLMNTCYISVEWMNRSLAGQRIDGEKFCFPWKFDKIKYLEILYPLSKNASLIISFF